MHKFFIINYKKILRSIIVLSCIFLLISLWQISRGNITGFQPLLYGFGFFLYGAFNWADVLVFAVLWIIICSVLLRIEKTIYFWIAFYSFWFIRSAGETIYSFLQQFNPHYRPWLMYAPRALMQHTWFGKFILVRYWVVEQIFFQSIAILSLFGLVYVTIKIIKDK